MYLTDKHEDLIAERILEVNRRLATEDDPARIRYYSVAPDPDLDYLWVIYVKFEVPDDYFPDLPTVKETLEQWPIERTNHHRDLLCELFDVDTTYPQFDTVPFYFSSSDLLDDDDMSAQPQPEPVHS